MRRIKLGKTPEAGNPQPRLKDGDLAQFRRETVKIVKVGEAVSFILLRPDDPTSEIEVETSQLVGL